MSAPSPLDPYHRERSWTHRVLLALIVLLTLASLTGFAPHVDLGVFATLAGMDCAVLGVGAVIRLVGPK